MNDTLFELPPNQCDQSLDIFRSRVELLHTQSILALDQLAAFGLVDCGNRELEKSRDYAVQILVSLEFCHYQIYEDFDGYFSEELGKYIEPPEETQELRDYKKLHKKAKVLLLELIKSNDALRAAEEKEINILKNEHSKNRIA